MKKHVKYILLGLFTFSFVVVAASLIWIYAGDPPTILTPIAKVFFVLWLICFFLLQFYIETKDTRADHKKTSLMKERAYLELCYAVVNVNHYYQLMVREKDREERARLEASYHKAREDFLSKAKMIDVIFLTQTVLIEGKDEEGNIIEITYDSRPA